MIETSHIIVAAIIIVILLMVFMRNTGCNSGSCENAANRFQQERSDGTLNENFDTHRNHSMGAQSIYAETAPEITLNEAERDARYQWSVRNPMGMQLYDKFYEQKLLEEYQTYTDGYEYDNDNQYDLKFEIDDVQNYSQNGMREPQLRGSFRGNIITFAQKIL